MIEAIRQVRPRHLLVAAVLAAPFLVFFAPTLVAGNAPGAFDLSYQSSPWREETERPLDAQSPVQIDQAEQLPWVDGMWEALGEGRVPMWTPAVGGGTSLGTNPVFATYSVFTIVGQLAGGAIGLAIRVLLGVAVAELFTYLVLRRMRLSVGASVLGTVAYVFSGATIAFETRNAIPLLFPVALWCTDRLVERASPGRVVALAAAVLALWLEGFPAMLVHAVVVCGVWWLVRSATTIGLDVRDNVARRAWLRATAAFGGAMVLGVMLSAFSAVPFALQLKYNDVFGARATEAAPLPKLSAWWLLDERALGIPDRGPWYMALNPFEGEAAVGTIVMALAVVGVVLGAVRGRGRLAVVRTSWAAIVAVLVTAIYLGGPVLDALYALPGFSGNPFSRIRFVVAFGLAVLAAVGLTEIDEWTAAPSEEASERVRRWPHLIVAGAFVVLLAAPFVASLGEYIDVAREFAPSAKSSWFNELAMLAAAIVVVGLVVWGGRRLGDRWQPYRGIVVGGLLAAIVFAQVGLQLTRFTPQVDRAFYYPETEGYDALREVADGQYRFLGSGMGTFAPNTAMTNDVVDARSHSFRDPEWKTLMLSVFPDATAIDPLKINVDFHGNVKWDSPVFDDLAIGVLAMSSGEIPLGNRNAPAQPEDWATAQRSDVVSGPGPDGPYVGLDLYLRTAGNCGQGDVVVRASSDGEPTGEARRPLDDARAAGVSGAPVPFAMPMQDVGDGAATEIEIGVDGAPEDCRLDVGVDGDEPLAGPISLPPGAEWKVESAIGGWLYSRASAAPLVRTIDTWVPYDDSDDALAAAASPFRVEGEAMPVGRAGPPPESPSRATVETWSVDDHGITVAVRTSHPTMLVTSFNSSPGWTVTVDGEAATLTEPDGAFLGVELPDGEHNVRFEYTMPGLAAGTLISLVGLLACIGLVVVPRLWTRRVRSRSGAGEESPGTPAAAVPD